MKKTLCFYVEGQTGILDTATNDGKSSIYGKDVSGFRKDHPLAELVPFDYALERINEALKEKYPMLQPVEITEEKFNDMFECLPPYQVAHNKDGFSFKMSEMTFGDITTGYVSKNGKHFEMYVRTHTPHSSMCAVCK